MNNIRNGIIGIGLPLGLSLALTGCAIRAGAAEVAYYTPELVVEVDTETIIEEEVVQPEDDDSVVDLSVIDNVLEIGSQVFIDRSLGFIDGEIQPRNEAIFPTIFNWNDVIVPMLSGLTPDERWNAVHDISRLTIIYESWTDETRTELSPAILRVSGRGNTDVALIDVNGNVIQPEEVRNFTKQANGAQRVFEGRDNRPFAGELDMNSAIFSVSSIEDNEIIFIRMTVENQDFFYNFDENFIADLRPITEGVDWRNPGSAGENWRTWAAQNTMANSARGRGFVDAQTQYDIWGSDGWRAAVDAEPQLVRDVAVRFNVNNPSSPR